MKDELRNKNISLDRTIVENYFGRQWNYFTALKTRFRWDTRNYDAIFVFASLTNLLVKLHPLRDEDSTAFERYKKRLYRIEDDTTTKRNRTQGEYGARLLAWQSRSFSKLNFPQGAVAMLYLFEDWTQFFLLIQCENMVENCTCLGIKYLFPIW